MAKPTFQPFRPVSGGRKSMSGSTPMATNWSVQACSASLMEIASTSPCEKRPGASRAGYRTRTEDRIAGAVLSVAGTSTTSDLTGYFELTIPPNRLQRELPLQATASGFEPSHTNVVPGSNDATVILKRSP